MSDKEFRARKGLIVEGTANVSGNLTISGIIANGGIGTAGQALISNGSSTYWASQSVTVGGSNTYVMINDSGAINGTAGFTFNKTTNNVFIGNTLGIGVTSTSAEPIKILKDSDGSIRASLYNPNTGNFTSVGFSVYTNANTSYIDLTTNSTISTILASGVNELRIACATQKFYLPATNTTAGIINSTATYVYNEFNDASANTTQQTLTDASTINWNAASGRIATVTLGATGRTMAAPTNLKVGTYILHILQDATGSRTITTWNSVYKWPANVAPTLSTAANARDIVSFICDGTNMYGSYITGF